MATPPPVLFIHGINDTGRNFRRMMTALGAEAPRGLRAVDLAPNNGNAPIPELAQQVEDAARALMEEAKADRLDLIGFSMGSLVGRYWLQRMGGKARTRRFISISGPHAGTWLAHLSGRPGIRDMRPDSPLLKDLEADPDPWGDVETHVLYTPLDLMIVPAKSSALREVASQTTFPVVLHPLMLSDRRVIEHVTRLLSAGS